MANLSEAQRAQMERAELGYSGDRLSRATPGQQRVWAGLTVLFVLVLGALSYAAIQYLDAWAPWVILADLIIVFFGFAAWVNPRRKNV